ncbi:MULTISPECIES: site-specific DNA-methyltransferase [Fusobacterium]|nr:site-specific DNA-methyltransferase [Fusobacterium vincentii]
MEKLNGTSMDLVQENVKKLKEIFPEIFIEGRIDFDLLRQICSGGGVQNTEGSKERYSLTWNGKSRARQIAQEVSTGTLRPAKEESKNWNNTENIYIEGDNLEVLKLLQKSYHGKIKMIYIDPPYNTGKDFVYKDNFTDNIENYKKVTGQINEEGTKLTTNTDSDGRYHSNWLNMMYPRLKLARNLLTDDGVIFISIDDNEQENLKKICDEIFGEENFINLISIKAKASSGASGGGEDKKLKKNIEYLLVYSKSIKFETFNSIYKYTPLDEYIEERKKDGVNFAYTNVMIEDGKESFFTTIKAGNGEEIVIKKVEDYKIKSVKKITEEENLVEYEVYKKYINKIYTLENAQTSIRDRILETTGEEDEFYNCYYKPVSGRNKGILTKVGFMGKTKRLVSYLSNVVEIQENEIIKKDKIGTLWDDLSWSSIHLEGEVEYNNGKKPVALIERILKMMPLKDEDIILDFFSGSATTIHSMFKYIVENLVKLKCILIQLPESLEKNLKNASRKTKNDILKQINFLKNLKKPLFISEIGKERIRRAGEKIKSDESLPLENREKLDIGFKVFKLDSSNIKEWDTNTEDLQQTLLDSMENIKSDRNLLDVLYEILLKYGLDLNIPIEENKDFYSIGGGSLLVSLNQEINNEVINSICEEYKKLLEIDKDFKTTVILRDNSFKNDVDKTNAIKKLEQVGINEIRSI